MQIDVVEAPPEGVEADVLAFPVQQPAALAGAAEALDRHVEGALRHLIDDGELKGEKGAVTLFHTHGRIAAHRVAAAGLGEVEGVDADAYRTAAARVAVRAAEIGSLTVAWVVDEDDGALSATDRARAIVEGTALGPYDAGRWKTNGDERRAPVERLLLCGSGAAGVAEEARRANVVAEWTNRCRDLVNAPPNELTPETLAEWAETNLGALEHVRFEALGPEEIRAARMGALGAVSQGSANPARLISLRYRPPDARGGIVLGLVGKAITFDAGGLSLKPPDRMEEMKADMSGGGAVLAGLGAVAELELPVEILAVVPASENMPGGHAYRPGDIITAMNGKTIEVTNTDAEGRLILADALWYARESGATHIVDFATLTGAMVIAMGDYYAGVFGNEAEWVEQVRAAGEASGDHVWPWPLHDTYRRFIRSRFADMKNSSEHRQGSPILAARFLEEFVGAGPWAHLDIAGTAYLERGRDDYYDRDGATGYGVRLVAELARSLTASS